jgi:hypothetical protein
VRRETSTFTALSVLREAELVEDAEECFVATIGMVAGRRELALEVRAHTLDRRTHHADLVMR